MKRLMVMAVTGALALGCAASQYKFTCTNRVCEVETAGPATLDFQKEFGTTLQVIETQDDRVTMQAGGARVTARMSDNVKVGPLRVTVKNIKGENAFFTVRR